MARHLLRSLSVVLSTVLVFSCFNSVVLAEEEQTNETEQDVEIEQVVDPEQFDSTSIQYVNITLEAPVVGTVVSLNDSLDIYNLQNNGPVVSGPEAVDVVGVWVTGTVGPNWEVSPSDPSPDQAVPFKGPIESGMTYDVAIRVIPHDGYALADDAMYIINGVQIASDKIYDSTQGRYFGFSIKSVMPTVEPVPEFTGMSVTLDGLVGLDFHVDPHGVDMQGAYVSFEGNTIEDQMNVVGVPVDGELLYTIKIAPYQLGEEITATLHYGDGESLVLTQTSGCDYLNAVINDTTSSYKSEEKTISKALMIYGYNSQVFLADYNGWTIGVDYAAITQPANSDLSEQFDLVASLTNDIDIVDAGLIDSDSVASRLIIGAEITLVVRFKLAEGVSDADVTVNDAQKSSDGYYYANFNNISAGHVSNLKTITVSNGNSDATIKASPMTYAHRILSNDNSSVALKNLLCSIYLYNSACSTFFPE